MFSCLLTHLLVQLLIDCVFLEWKREIVLREEILEAREIAETSQKISGSKSR